MFFRCGWNLFDPWKVQVQQLTPIKKHRQIPNATRNLLINAFQQGISTLPSHTIKIIGRCWRIKGREFSRQRWNFSQLYVVWAKPLGVWYLTKVASTNSVDQTFMEVSSKVTRVVDIIATPRENRQWGLEVENTWSVRVKDNLEEVSKDAGFIDRNDSGKCYV